MQCGQWTKLNSTSAGLRGCRSALGMSKCKTIIVNVVCHSRTVNNTHFFSLFLSLPFLTFSFFLCWLPYFYALHLCLHSLTLLNDPPLSVFHPNFSLHRMQYAPTCPSISVLWDMRMTLARSGWSMTVNSSTDVIWVVDDPESSRKRTSTFLCHSKLCFQPLLLCASLCLHTFMYLFNKILLKIVVIHMLYLHFVFSNIMKKYIKIYLFLILKCKSEIFLSSFDKISFWNVSTGNTVITISLQ